jgi:hypothetical protein
MNANQTARKGTAKQPQAHAPSKINLVAGQGFSVEVKVGI